MVIKRGERREGREGRDKRDKKKRPKPYAYMLRKKKCRFCGEKTLEINYLNSQLLRKMTTERGKIIPSRISGTCAKHQRKLAKAIKKSRNIGLLPYLAD